MFSYWTVCLEALHLLKSPCFFVHITFSFFITHSLLWIKSVFMSLTHLLKFLSVMMKGNEPERPLQREIPHSILSPRITEKISWVVYWGVSPTLGRTNRRQMQLDSCLMELVELGICAEQGLTTDFISPRSPQPLPGGQRWTEKAADCFLGTAISHLLASHKWKTPLALEVNVHVYLRWKIVSGGRKQSITKKSFGLSQLQINQGVNSAKNNFFHVILI